MADAKRVIEIVFGAVDETSKVVTSITGSVDKFGNSLLGVTAPIANVTNSILALEGAAGLAAVALIGVSVDAAGKFQEKFNEIGTLITANAAETEEFRQSMIKFGSDSVSSLESVQEATYNAISAGVDFKDSIDVVANAEHLAIAGRADLNDVTVLLVSTLNAYGASMDEADKFSNAFFNTVKFGQTTVPQLAASVGQVAPVAKVAGVSIEELGATIATLTANGIKTSESVTAVKAALSNVIKPSKEAGETAKELGIDFSVAAIQTKGWVGFLEDLSSKTGGNVETMAKLFGSVEALNGVLSLTSDGTKKLGGFLQQMKTDTEALDKAYKAMSDSITNATNNMTNNIKLAAIAFGDPLVQPFIDVEKAIAQIFKQITASVQSGALKPVQDFIANGLKEIETFLLSVAKVLPEALAQLDFSKFLNALGELGGQVGAIFAGADLTTAKGLADALQLLINLGTQFISFTQGVVQAWAPLIKALFDGAQGFASLSPEVTKLFGVLGGISQMLGILVPLVQTMGQGFGFFATLLTAGGLIGNMDKLTTSVTKLASSGGIGALVIAAGAAGFAIGNFIDQTFGAADAQDKWGAKIAAFVNGPSKQEEEANQKAIAAMQARQLQVGGNIQAEKDLEGQTNSNIDSFESWAKAAEDLGGTLKQNADGLYEVVIAQAALDTATNKTKEQFRLLAGEVQLSAQLSEDLAKKGFFSMGETLTFVGQAAEETGAKTKTALEKTAEATLKAEQQAQQFSLEWEKLASEERQLVFSLAADIQIEQIKAQAAQTIAAFESINAAIESTGETMSDLAKLFTEAEGFDKLTLERLLEEENQRRQEAFEQQKELVAQQIKYLQATIDKLNSGDALITVTADGLQPELEAFMFKILERVQIKASSEGQAFLLGLGGL